MRIIKVLLISFLFFSFGIKHPFYLGITDLKYNPKEKSLQGSAKLFTNDLEDALKKIYKVQVDLINGKDKTSLNNIVGDYLKNHLKLKINGKPMKAAFLGFEHESEAIWMYFEYEKCAVPKKIEMENSFLYENIKSQINLVHCEVNGNTQSSKVTNPDKNLSFQY
ncbi:MAG: hypothetical protein JWO32_1750 [Bacteroidetes bacterium]|nr:hypothetical protein [Bacteroidota bacterium]